MYLTLLFASFVFPRSCIPSLYVAAGAPLDNQEAVTQGFLPQGGVIGSEDTG